MPKTDSITLSIYNIYKISKLIEIKQPAGGFVKIVVTDAKIIVRDKDDMQIGSIKK